MRKLRDQPSGRWFVAAGALVGVGTTIAGIAGDWNPAQAVVVGLVAAALTMIVCGVGQSFWRGREVGEAKFPGGGGIGFKDEVKETTEQLNRRLTGLMDEVNDRLLDVEKRVEESPVSADKTQE